MSKYKAYQCKLQKLVGKTTSEVVSWIPEKFAVVGKVVKIRDDKTDEWSDGWVVASVSDRLMEKGELEKLEKQHKDHRMDLGITEVEERVEEKEIDKGLW